MQPSHALLALALAAAPAAGQETAKDAARAPRPANVVLIAADDLGWGELGCYGQRWIKTPNVDRLAAEGMRFTDFHSGSPVCAPSRCTLLTGKHTGHAFVRDNGNPPERGEPRPDEGYFPGQFPLPDAEVTLAELFHGAGYATAGYGKWGLGFEGSNGDPLRQGFDHFGGYLCQVDAHNHYPRTLWLDGERVELEGNTRTLNGAQHSQDWFVERGLEFVRANAERPFFLYLAFTVPHLSIQADPALVAEYAQSIPEAEYEHKGYLKHPTPRAGYAAMVTQMDRGIGRVLDLLEELGLEGDTLVVFTSDNGPTYDRLGGSDSDFFASAGPYRGRKGSVLEGGIRVPLVVRWPGRVAPGSTSDVPAAWWDLYPTLAAAAGATPPEGIDGIDLGPVLRGGPAPAERTLYWEFPSYGGQQAVRRGRWKLVRTGLLQAPEKRTLALFNLEADPGESTDRAGDEPEVVRALEAAARDARVPSTLFPFPALDGDARPPR